jgi:hypothetical protein
MLDAYEDVDLGAYQRIKVDVLSDLDTSIKCWIYIFNP